MTDYILRYNGRRFLNPMRGVAAIECSIEAYRVSKEVIVSAGVSIGDCSRTIVLDFDAYDASDTEDNMAKLNLLIAELTAFRDVLEDAYAELKDEEEDGWLKDEKEDE